MLVHICCSVDSHYFLSELQKVYPEEKMIGFFYNPNIHPKSEHDLRLLDVRRSCEMLGVELHEGKYDDADWTQSVRGLEDEPEKGERCSVCFDVRLIESAKMAQTLGQKTFTTTLLSSPMKTQQVLFAQGDKIAQDFGLDFVKIDVRSNGGTQKQNELSKKDNLYRQNYCGCKFALQKQREKQGRFPLEFISPVSGQVMPGSIEYRNAVFAKRDELEKHNKPYILTQQTQLIWRCLSAKVSGADGVIPSYILAHSCSKKSVRLGQLLWIDVPEIGRVGYSRRDDSVFLTLEGLNALLHVDYQSVEELCKNPLHYQDELHLRSQIAPAHSLIPIVIIQKELEGDMRLEINSVFQEERVFEVIEIKMT
ncbi:epoxyqueuosine reductase QueH [Helicobacter pametensis]|uniref:epoxyqueuosine reductase QueH n=1 Tax=Helicobacter pametensis TaxID=95149 RepID=UPI00047F9231|nr:epoxyqueuosine reductase QueH [Helicobacter pametensis]